MIKIMHINIRRDHLNYTLNHTNQNNVYQDKTNFP